MRQTTAAWHTVCRFCEIRIIKIWGTKVSCGAELSCIWEGNNIASTKIACKNEPVGWKRAFPLLIFELSGEDTLVMC